MNGPVVFHPDDVTVVRSADGRVTGYAVEQAVIDAIGQKFWFRRDGHRVALAPGDVMVLQRDNDGRVSHWIPRSHVLWPT